MAGYGGGFQREKRRRKGGGDIAYVVVAKPFSRTRIPVVIVDRDSNGGRLLKRKEERYRGIASRPVWYISLSLTLCLAKLHGW
jgi:hypothetical protein